MGAPMMPRPITPTRMEHAYRRCARSVEATSHVRHDVCDGLRHAPRLDRPHDTRDVMDAPSTPALDAPTKIAVRELSMYYGDTQALTDVTLEIPDRRVTALIGPSGCGKSTFLRCLNRMNDHIRGIRIDGSVTHGRRGHLRRRTSTRCCCDGASAWCSRSRNPFPKSIFENVAFGPRIHGLRDDPARCARSSSAACSRPPSGTRWPIGSTRSALELSGGQQQRLCIARALAVRTRGAVDGRARLGARSDRHRQDRGADPRAQGDYTIVIVTHNMQQAARVSDYTAYFYLGRLIEYGPTHLLFTTPSRQETEDYITGRFG